ncbi:MAG TPA: TlpA disulfide reductase family protein [Bryobacteraceae bacterium]|nr:TlpA disulfide reductase family protein [Bryobacteraceae bacterium]
MTSRISGILAGFLGLCLLAALAQQTVSLVDAVRGWSMAGDFAMAEKGLAQFRAAHGITPEYLQALSWVGRNRLARHQPAEAEKNAAEVMNLSVAQLTHRKLDAEPLLPLALGAGIEVQAQAVAAENRRDEAVLFLNEELKKYGATSMHDRLQKNLNLLTLEGKPAPVLDISHGVGAIKPLPLSAHRGHPVLLFLWAHWCSDCKNEIDIVKKLEKNYGPRGLVVVAPTQHYGYVAGGQDAAPAVETKYIGEVFTKYYSTLGPVEVPLSESNFAKLGVSTTPTMVVIDGQGIVRLYNPGNATYETLAAKIEAALRAPVRISRKG